MKLDPNLHSLLNEKQNARNLRIHNHDIHDIYPVRLELELLRNLHVEVNVS